MGKSIKLLANEYIIFVNLIFLGNNNSFWILFKVSESLSFKYIFVVFYRGFVRQYFFKFHQPLHHMLVQSLRPSVILNLAFSHKTMLPSLYSGSLAKTFICLFLWSTSQSSKCSCFFCYKIRASKYLDCDYNRTLTYNHLVC